MNITQYSYCNYRFKWVKYMGIQVQEAKLPRNEADQGRTKTNKFHQLQRFSALYAGNANHVSIQKLIFEARLVSDPFQPYSDPKTKAKTDLIHLSSSILQITHNFLSSPPSLTSKPSSILSFVSSSCHGWT